MEHTDTIIETTSSEVKPEFSRSHPGRCTVAVVRNEMEFDNLAAEWNQTAMEADVSVFQTFEWQRTWWKYFGSNRELHCLIFRFESRLVGIAPMFLDYARAFGLKIATRLCFMGTGISDYLDIIIVRGYEKIVLKAFVRYLRSTRNMWDIFEIVDLNERSPVFHHLPFLLANEGLRVYTYQGGVCPQVPLPESWESFLKSLSGKMRYQLKKKKENLNRSFRYEVEIFENEKDNIEMAVEEFIKLHERRWKGLGFSSAFDDPNHRHFHIEVAEKLARRGWLRLFFLKVNSIRVAVSFDFNFNKRIHVYLSHAHGPDEIMKQSPGFLIRCMAIQRGIEEGMKIYDLLRGNEPYKYEELMCVASKNWLVRATVPSGGRQLRFTIFILSELISKSLSRLYREYHELKRFFITKKLTPATTFYFLSSRAEKMFSIIRSYFSTYFRTSARF